MSSVRPVPVAELRSRITDASELAKGTEIADRGGLTHLARHENKLFADAAGSGAAPYKAQIVFGDDKLTGRCSCMAARSRPYCKHAAALLVSWARSPEAFAVAEAPPAPAPGDKAAKRASVKKSKVDQSELFRKGVDQVYTLLSELWQTGALVLAADRAEQVAELATSLRELGLRRLSARTLELAELLRLAARRDESFPTEAYAGLVADMWLTVRKLEKYLAGEALADEHVEELIGKTWTKKDRKPTQGLDLFEYAFLQRTTADGFLLRESRLFELTSGEHFSEKQILPAQLAKRLPPKPSYRGRRLSGASGSLFPTFAPKRLDLEATGTPGDVDQATLRLALERALPSVTQALAALIERRRDVFAPPSVPVLLRVDWLVPAHDRVRFVDEQGGTLFLAGGRAQEDALMTALSGSKALAVFGDVMLQGALPSLLPLAVIGETDGELRLDPLGGDDALGAAEAPKPGRSGSWAETAKRIGVSPAATLLGEVRDDLAQGFTDGVHACTSTRFIEPLATRLGELQLAKQADALRAVTTANDAVDALDAVVKIHQVLGIALSRLAGTTPVDRAQLVRIPTLPSVAIPRPAETLAPELAVAREARGEIHRYERAYHVGVHYQKADARALLESTERLWGDGFAVPFVLRAARQEPQLAVEKASLVLAEAVGKNRWQPCPSRLAKLTAIAILGASGSQSARAQLSRSSDFSLDAQVRRALQGPLLSAEELERTTSMLLTGSSKDDRARAVERLASHACIEAFGPLRAALRDRTSTVRKAAAYALASLGDVDALDTFVTWLEGDDHELAKVGAHAIGYLGDLRGVGAMLAALARGFSPTVVREALELLGPWVLGPLLDLSEGRPELAKRTAVSSLVRTFSKGHSASTIAAWIDAAGDDTGKLARRAKLGLETASGRHDLLGELIVWLQETHAAVLAGDDPDARALKKKLDATQRSHKKREAPAT